MSRNPLTEDQRDRAADHERSRGGAPSGRRRPLSSTRAAINMSSCSSSSRSTIVGATVASYGAVPIDEDVDLRQSTSANMRRTTLPLPRAGSCRTTAPGRPGRARRSDRSSRCHRLKYQSRPAAAARIPCTTEATAASSLRRAGIRTPRRDPWPRLKPTSKPGASLPSREADVDREPRRGEATPVSARPSGDWARSELPGGHLRSAAGRNGGRSRRTVAGVAHPPEGRVCVLSNELEPRRARRRLSPPSKLRGRLRSSTSLTATYFTRVERSSRSSAHQSW